MATFFASQADQEDMSKIKLEVCNSPPIILQEYFCPKAHYCFAKREVNYLVKIPVQGFPLKQQALVNHFISSNQISMHDRTHIEIKSFHYSDEYFRYMYSWSQPIHSHVAIPGMLEYLDVPYMWSNELADSIKRPGLRSHALEFKQGLMANVIARCCEHSIQQINKDPIPWNIDNFPYEEIKQFLISPESVAPFDWYSLVVSSDREKAKYSPQGLDTPHYIETCMGSLADINTFCFSIKSTECLENIAWWMPEIKYRLRKGYLIKMWYKGYSHIVSLCSGE